MTNQDYNNLSNAAHKWLDKSDNYKNNKYKVFGIKPTYFIIAFIVLLMAISKKNNSANNTEITKSVAENYILYEKPNNKSNIILQEGSKNDVNIIDETKYFYKVEIQKNGSNYTGYVNKENVTK